MEFVSKVVEIILDYTLIPMAQQVGYVISYKDNVSELKKQVKRLLSEREALQHRVDDAKRNGEVIENWVKDWLCEVIENASKAKILLDEDDKRHKRNGKEIEGEDLKWPSDIGSKVEELLDGDDKRSKTTWCSSKSFSSMCWRHGLSRKAKKLAQEIANFRGEKEFTKVSYRRKLEITETWPNAEAFESRDVALNQIMEALANPNLRLIGVYGLGGVGKTTLVREVARKVKEMSPDMEVVFVDVKQNPKIEKIQQEIAETLGLELKQQSLLLRATSLRQRLEQEKNILVILDDIWEKLDLNGIGVAFGKENKNYKILMTSRKRDVLSKMDTQKNFWLRELTKEESWELFKVKVVLNESSKSKELLTIAGKVVAECGGLPIAIVTIAAALKGKEEIAKWRDVLRRLQNHDYHEINRPIEVSYENLKEDHLRSIFVLAGVINSSATIDLFKYSCGLGLFYDMDNLDARINELKDSCLLQDNGSSGSHFSMHDVVRDTAISIASRDEQFFLKKIGKVGEDEWITDEKLKSCSKMILDFSHIGEFPEGLQCSNLTFFYLRSKDSSLKLPHNFFKGTPKLKVLVLINMTLEFLPSSISHLPNLHTLCLDECVLDNIEGIGELKGFKILSLSGSEFTNLPQEIGKLTKLQLLDLSRCFQLECIPPGVLLNLHMLEVLLIGSSFEQWAVGDQQSTASHAEIKDLRHLNTLALRVPNQNMLPKEQLFEGLQLQRYEVCIGDTWYRFGESKTSRLLQLDLDTGTVDTKHYFKSLLDHVEDLHVQRLAGLKNVVPDINEKGLIELKHLVVEDNRELQFIADLADHKSMIFPKLESLDARSSNLVKLCNGSITEGSFSKLKVVKVLGCIKIKRLFSFSFPTCLPHLDEIQVEFCRVLEGIVSEDGKVVGPLQFAELRTLTLSHVPSLIGFHSEDKKSSKAQQKKMQLADDNILDPPVVLFSHKVFIPNLEKLSICAANKLNKIWDQQGQQLGNLKTLNVKSCHGISKLLPFNVLENLEELEVSSCKSLEVIFELEGARNEGTRIVKSSHLRKLTLNGLPNLKHVWNKDSPEFLDFQCLSTIEASEEGADVSIDFVFARVTELHLQWLPKLRSFYPGTYSTKWPLLQKLSYKSVNRDLNIFGFEPRGFEESYCRNGVKASIQSSLAIEKSIPMLRELKLDCNKNMLAWIQQHSPDFCLRELKILKLGFFRDMPLWSFIQHMYALKTLHVKYGSLEEVFPLEGAVSDKTQHDSRIHIKTLTLDRLFILKHICRENGELNPILKKLEELHVIECSSLTNLVPSSVKFNHLASLKVFKCNRILHLMSSFTARSLSRLTTMEIKECKIIKEIVAEKVIDDEIIFRELKTLKLDDLPRLESFCSLDYIFNFPALENVVISQCPKLKLFSKQAPNTTKLRSVKDNDWSGADSYWEDDLNSTVQKLYTDKLYYELEDLNLSEYPELKQIWNTQLLNGAFRKLDILTLSNCEWSSKVLQWNVLKCLVNLKELKVESCKSIIVVFDLEEATYEERDCVLVMDLRALTLTSLPNLKYIWNKDLQGILDFPKLTTLKLVDVPKIDHSLVEKAIPNLKRFVVDEAIMTWFRQLPEDHFNSLEALGLQFFNDVNTGFPYSVLQKMSNLKTLIVKDGLFEEIFPFKKQVVEGNYGGLVQVKSLRVENLQKLRHICEEGYELDPSLKNLEGLFVEECSSLLNLGPSLLTFNFLKILRVKKCERLSYLMTPSTARSLNKLRFLTIEDCSMIKEIISSKVDDAETIDEITFSKLGILMLKNLPCLESFCPMNYVFNFPFLKVLFIWQCPSLKKFSNGVSSTPNLEYIAGDGGRDWLDFDLNSTGPKMYKYKVVSEDVFSAVPYVDEFDMSDVDSEDDFSEVDDLLDSGDENEHLNESDQFEEEEDKVEEHKENEEEKEENINGCLIEQISISYPKRDTDLQVSTNEDFTLCTPLLATSQEYQTSEEGDRQKKKEDINEVEQSSSSYSKSRETHKKKTEGFEISINDFDTKKSLQEQDIIFEESIEETGNVSDENNLPLEILTKATSSLDSVIEEPMGELGLMDRKGGLEQNQFNVEFLDRTDVTSEVDRRSPISQSFSSIANAAVSPGNMLSGLDLSKETETIKEDSYQRPRNEGKNKDLLNIKAGSLGEATLDLPSSVPVDIEQNRVPVGDLPTELNFNNKTMQWDNFDNSIGSLEVKPIEVVESTQDCQESDTDGNKSNSFLQTQTMTRHAGEFQAKEVHQEPKKPHISPTNKGEDITKKESKSELVLTDQQITLEGNKASRDLQPLATNSHLSPISYQSLHSVTEASGPPLTATAAIPSPLEDLLSRLLHFSSSEDMSYLRDGFSRYPWALRLLESWSDERWKWSYFIIFARVLCILQTTRAADLSETLNAELNSSLNTLENVGFNASWIAAVRSRIRECQDGLTNINEAKALRATKDVLAGRLRELELAMQTELARIDNLLAKYAQREELARNVIGLP